jgi:hypothetical protein
VGAYQVSSNRKSGPRYWQSRGAPQKVSAQGGPNLPLRFESLARLSVYHRAAPKRGLKRGDLRPPRQMGSSPANGSVAGAGIRGQGQGPVS